MPKANRLLILILAAVAGLLLQPPVDAQDLTQGAMLSASCEGCHGTNGANSGSIPSISGKTVDYLREALIAFRSGEREATVMGRHAKAYSDEEIEQIARHFAKQQ
jgi:sulfide dehydrogenase cytochrome subunit